MLNGKKIVLGVTGSIAAYKIANLASMLVKQGAKVTVLMTQNATNFINPITFETLTGNKCLIDTFDRNFQYSVEHVSLAKETDLVLVAPASANVIAKLAHGIADDMLTTTILACECKKLVAPAMNTHMYHNPIVQDNLQILKKFGMEVIKPDYGYLACGDIGDGKMPSEELLLAQIERHIAYEKDLTGKRVLVTAGPTQEAIDPVRFVTNHSSGKMGYAIAKAAMLRGAKVTLVTGPTALKHPDFVEVIPVVSAKDMFTAVKDVCMEHDIIIKAAAVADYTPSQVAQEKIKKAEDTMELSMEKTTDILAFLGTHRRRGQILCGFSMETEHMRDYAKGKLEKKNLDMIVANNLRQAGAGFSTDTNIVTIFTKETEKELPLMSKEEVAHSILDEIIAFEQSKKI
ncbi:MAG: phosphopantothenoylcysteine decarboxylase / phosphopantothenate---cysteine ligase [Clostridiales bacterium]|nr:phosphopantothenoylcysteine decarboxylase / phosphopantothenate---cysteine ligase [Clostridiales bacterium]